jgi:hypothetical protein
MPMPVDDPLSLNPEQLEFLLGGDASFFPELEAARANPAALRERPSTRFVLEQTEGLMAEIARIPQTSYTHYRYFVRNGDRKHYEGPYFAKRTCLGAAALRLFLGQAELKDVVQDYLWNICEETNWVLPAHERGNVIDLFAAETGFLMGQTLTLLGDTLDAEVRERAQAEVERRILAAYLEGYAEHGWYHGPHNWNGVCNSSVAATFLLLDADRARAARAVALAFAGLRTFLKTAFEEHLEQTKNQVQRLEQIFGQLGEKPKGKKCRGMKASSMRAKRCSRRMPSRRSGMRPSSKRPSGWSTMRSPATAVLAPMLERWAMMRPPGYFSRRSMRKERPTRS